MKTHYPLLKGLRPLAKSVLLKAGFKQFAPPSFENNLEEMCNGLGLELDHAQRVAVLWDKSKAQLKQDLFVLAVLGFKPHGFFVEFGATNGVDLSNSWLLEKEFGWRGILAEPAQCWHEELKNNRSASIETNCVWVDSNSALVFNEVELAEFSTISTFNTSDNHAESRKIGQSYPVNTISLLDLLNKYDAPAEIDYLSIDTEGSEFDILNNFDFSKYSFKVITCEHNFTPMREKIFKLLTSKGYERRHTGLSKWDDWYVKI